MEFFGQDPVRCKMVVDNKCLQPVNCKMVVDNKCLQPVKCKMVVDNKCLKPVNSFKYLVFEVYYVNANHIQQ
jgi:hypothetical protein